MRISTFFKKKEVNNAGWLIGGKIVQMVISFFVGIITARYLGPSNYGLINYGATYVSFFAALCTLGLNAVIIKDFVDHPDEQGEAIGSSLLMRAMSSILSSLMTIGIVMIVDHDEPLTILVVALCSLGAIFQVFDTINYWFQYQYKSKITAIASTLAYVITSIYKILLLIFGKSVEWFALATSVDYLVIAVFLLVAYKKHSGPRLSVSFRKSKNLLRISYNYILSTIMVSIYGHTDTLMIKQFLNETEVGYYATAVAICNMWTFVLKAIIDSIYPTIIQLKSQNTGAYERKNRQLYAIVFYLSCGVSVCFTLFGKFVVNILYGAEYAPAAPILSMVTWYTAFSYLGVARNAWIVSEGKQRYLKYIYALAAVINVLLNLVFIPWIGTMGAAIASLITQILTSIVLPMCIKELRPNAKLIVEAILLQDVFTKSKER